jgi:hypothetical protein
VDLILDPSQPLPVRLYSVLCIITNRIPPLITHTRSFSELELSETPRGVMQCVSDSSAGLCPELGAPPLYEYQLLRKGALNFRLHDHRR